MRRDIRTPLSTESFGFIRSMLPEEGYLSMDDLEFTASRPIMVIWLSISMSLKLKRERWIGNARPRDGPESQAQTVEARNGQAYRLP